MRDLIFQETLTKLDDGINVLQYDSASEEEGSRIIVDGTRNNRIYYQGVKKSCLMVPSAPPLEISSSCTLSTARYRKQLQMKKTDVFT